MSRKRNRQQRKNKKDTVNAVIYNQSDFQKDEKNFSMMENGRSDMDWSTFSRLMINDICTNSNILEDGYIGDYKIEDIELALKNPKIGWRILLYVSQKLMLISPHYYRLNNFFSNMALFCWWVDLYGVKDSANIDIVKKNYGTLTEKLENMNLKHEFSKIMKVLPYQDIFCGVIVENQNSNLPTVINGGVYAAGNEGEVNGTATVVITGNHIFSLYQFGASRFFAGIRMAANAGRV